MSNSKDFGSLDKLNDSLYSKAHAPRPISRGRLHEEHTESVPSDWAHDQEEVERQRKIELERKEQVLDDAYGGGGHSFLFKMFVGSLIFFILAMAIGAYIFFRGGNIVSANNVDIVVSGPVTVAGGDPFDFTVQVVNKNKVTLETVDLSFTYPTGAANPEKPSEELKQTREIIPDIAQGAFHQKQMTALLYGEQGSTKDIEIKVQYRVKGSSASFEKKTIYAVTMSSAPIVLSVDSNKEAISNQGVEFAVTIASNSKQPIQNLMLKAEYPYGFSYTGADIKPNYDTTVWKVGDIAPGQKKTIKIRGTLQGQDEEERVFRFAVGVPSVKSEKTMGTEFVRSEQIVKIKKPFISLAINLSGDNSVSDHVTTFDQAVHGEIRWFNNLTVPVTDVEINLKLEGNAYDKFSVLPEGGLFKSATNEILWDKRTSKDLASIGPGESGRVTFTVTPRELNKSKGTVNPFMKLSANVHANRVSEANVSGDILSSATRQIKISPAVSLEGMVLRKIGPFENIGPVPPKPEKVTSYTVTWTVSNTTSNISSAKVEATLPSYVSWGGRVSPAKEDISFNKSDGKLVWNLGSVRGYSADGSNKRQVSFQVTIEPSVSQVGETPTLVGGFVLSATDEYTGTQIRTEQPELTTVFDSDPSYRTGDGTISN